MFGVTFVLSALLCPPGDAFGEPASRVEGCDVPSEDRAGPALNKLEYAEIRSEIDPE